MGYYIAVFMLPIYVVAIVALKRGIPLNRVLTALFVSVLLPWFVGIVLITQLGYAATVAIVAVVIFVSSIAWDAFVRQPQ